MTFLGPYLSMILPKNRSEAPETTRPIDATIDISAREALNSSWTGLMKTEKVVQIPQINNKVRKEANTMIHPYGDLFLFIYTSTRRKLNLSVLSFFDFN